MNSDTISKFRLFGKAGKIVMTVLTVVAALITIFCCIAVAFVAALPDNALTVRVVENTELRFNAESFDTLWNIIGGSFSYSGESSPEQILGEGSGTITPPEDQQFKTELRLFNRSYDSAEIHSDGNTKVMQAEASPAEYIASDLTKVFIFAALFAASATAALWMLRGLFSVLTKCQSPFCGEVVAKMRGFGFSGCRFCVCRRDDAGELFRRRKKHQRQHSVGHFDCVCCNHGSGGCFQIRCSAAKGIG